MTKQDEQFERIEAVVSGSEDQTLGEAVARFYEHLSRTLELPCEVTGVEDFNWEERYVIGPGSPKEWQRLRKTQPSYQDCYNLLKITNDEESEWMLFPGEDIAAHVRRKSDGKEFVLGLAELKATDKKSRNFQLLEDFAVFLVNNR